MLRLVVTSDVVLISMVSIDEFFFCENKTSQFVLISMFPIHGLFSEKSQQVCFGQLIFSKHKENRFPETPEIFTLLSELPDMP